MVIPKGWRDCPSDLSLIDGTFITFKTPISNKKDGNISSILDYAKELDKSIGLWVDLTSTDRYYNRIDVESKGIKYVKLPLVGRWKVPPDADTDEFVKLCLEVLQNNKDAIIAVHGTNSFNRPGYLICSFLVRERGIPIKEALEIYANTRPPGIYQAAFVKVLWEKHGGIGPVPPIPSPPPWHVE